MSALEKVATAISDNIPNADPDSCRYAAIAALTALLDPDEGTIEAMVSRAHQSGWPTLDDFDAADARNAFQAAISHILKEGEGT
jgi:hypothetical protein